MSRITKMSTGQSIKELHRLARKHGGAIRINFYGDKGLNVISFQFSKLGVREKCVGVNFKDCLKRALLLIEGAIDGLD